MRVSSRPRAPDRYGRYARRAAAGPPARRAIRRWAPRGRRRGGRIAHHRRAVPLRVAWLKVGVLVRRSQQEGRSHRVRVLVAEYAAVASQPVENDRPALPRQPSPVGDNLCVHRPSVVVPDRPA
eukprot:7082491-Prymnesium_polylepis.1